MAPITRNVTHMNTEDLVLWFEFEAIDQSESWDADNEFFNMLVTYAGNKYALNVWSYGFMRKQLADQSATDDGFVDAPDLLVTTCTRAHMESVVDKLIQECGLREEWLTDEETV